MQFLRAWRESLGLTRQNVVSMISASLTRSEAMDQASLAKWESGETAVRVEDIEMLAKVYHITVDRMFFSPCDKTTPGLLQKAHEIIVDRDPEAVAAWLAAGAFLPAKN
jgi:transcriptional regulator with XRE-family HTH domain